ncbi:MAG: SAM-dependent methyltransferase [Clostridia bacterium]|nr:SAM-dependent methyltransferase [Clostridia bacterium]
MTKRLKTLYSLVKAGGVFADVGCDHGFVAKHALDSGDFESVIISDISKPSLEKAIKLLESYGSKAKAYHTDGVDAFDGLANVIFIAGMGGEEICQILKRIKTLPRQFVLSPQKNTKKVRKTLLELGYKIESDFTFYDKKYYDALSATKGTDSYTDIELIFGRDNLKNRSEDFLNKLKLDAKILNQVIENQNVSITERESASEKLKLINGVLYEN